MTTLATIWRSAGTSWTMARVAGPCGPSSSMFSRASWSAWLRLEPQRVRMRVWVASSNERVRHQSVIRRRASSGRPRWSSASARAMAPWTVVGSLRPNRSMTTSGATEARSRARSAAALRLSARGQPVKAGPAAARSLNGICSADVSSRAHSTSLRATGSLICAARFRAPGMSRARAAVSPWRKRVVS